VQITNPQYSWCRFAFGHPHSFVERE